MILFVMPPVFINSPASINKGIAIISSLNTPFQIRCGTMDIKAGVFVLIYVTQDAPIAKASGTPRTAKKISSTNKKLFEVLKKEYPDTFACVLLIKEMIFHKFSWSIEDEESLYLILHVNRLCSHEGVTNESA